MKPYLSVAETLRNRVVSGGLQSGQQIPSQNALALEFGASPATIQKSLKELERDGLIRCEHGRGRFVADFKRRQRTSTIGVILFDLRHLMHPVIGQRLTGIQDAIEPANYHLTTFAMNGNGEADRWLDSIDSTRIDGAVVIAQEAAPLTIQNLARSVPIVWMDAPFSGERLASVSVDYLGGGFAAARHLLDLGHRRIGFLGPPLHAYRVTREQHGGVRLAVEQIGADAAVSHIETAYYSEEEAEKVVGRLLTTAERPTALVCASDELARGAWRACAALGVRIPRDLSLVAWNDTIRTDEIPLPLTTVHMDYRQAGERSARRLLDLIEHPDHSFEEERLPARLIVRESTAAPRV